MQFLKKYQHGFWILSFGIFYLICFHYLERRPVESLHIIHATLDDKIPFCEYFILPYFLWFPYIFITVLYFIAHTETKQELYQLTKNLCMGMGLFLIISFIYPNGHNLRPLYFPRDNIFVDMVKLLYQYDTATNILPSIHVFNSLAVHTAIWNCNKLGKYRSIQAGSLFLTISIILSTMFLKQHSVVDVSMGTGLALLGYMLFYREPASSKQTSTAYIRNRIRLK